MSGHVDCISRPPTEIAVALANLSWDLALDAMRSHRIPIRLINPIEDSTRVSLSGWSMEIAFGLILRVQQAEYPRKTRQFNAGSS